MNTIKLIISKSLVERHYPHPELYGETIVALINGMTTDAYTNDQGQLVTETNNQELIQFLQNNVVADPDISLITNKIRLRTVKKTDVNQLLAWRNRPSYDEVTASKLIYEDVLIWIAHAITVQSHMFIIEYNQQPVGVAYYDVMNRKGFIDFNIYEKSYIDTIYIDEALHCFLSWIKTKHVISHFYSLVFFDVIYTKDLFQRNRLIADVQSIINVPFNKTEDEQGMYEYRSGILILPLKDQEVLDALLLLELEDIFSYEKQSPEYKQIAIMDQQLKKIASMIRLKQMKHQKVMSPLCMSEDQNVIISPFIYNTLEQWINNSHHWKRENILAYKDVIIKTLSIINTYRKVYRKHQSFHFTY